MFFWNSLVFFYDLEKPKWTFWPTQYMNLSIVQLTEPTALVLSLVLGLKLKKNFFLNRGCGRVYSIVSYLEYKNCNSLNICIIWASLVAQMVKNLPAVQETGVRSLGQEDPLEKGMATHSSILAWRIPWKESGRLQFMGLPSWTWLRD